MNKQFVVQTYWLSQNGRASGCSPELAEAENLSIEASLCFTGGPLLFEDIEIEGRPHEKNTYRQAADRMQDTT